MKTDNIVNPHPNSTANNKTSSTDNSTSQARERAVGEQICRQLDQQLLKLVNVQAVLIDAQTRQQAFVQALADHFGDHIPGLYQVLQSLEGDTEVAKQQQADLIAAFELNCRNKP